MSDSIQSQYEQDVYSKLTTEQVAALTYDEQSEYFLIMSIERLGNVAKAIYLREGSTDELMQEVAESCYSAYRRLLTNRGEGEPSWLNEEVNQLGAGIRNSLQAYIEYPKCEGSELANGQITDSDHLEAVAYDFRDSISEFETLIHDDLDDMDVYYPPWY